jgi:hypothetical protein
VNQLANDITLVMAAYRPFLEIVCTFSTEILSASIRKVILSG